MKKAYHPQKIERKWQKEWERRGIFRTKDNSKKPKKYILVEFPYPSGAGLHLGHCRPYVALDILAIKKRMEGFNVLFPMGWDAFGLPTENYAIKTGIPPEKVTKRNTRIFKQQMKRIGLSFDWSREITTSDPSYYKWTQWIFLQLFKHGMAYKKRIPINWCPSCKIGLANEEVVNGRCERCGTKVVRKEKEQWMLRITKYAERLISDLDKVDFPERVKTLERDWIGKSEGHEVEFQLFGLEQSITVFTSRLDTIFGASFLVLSPEHPAFPTILQTGKIKNRKAVEAYIERAKNKLERERLEKTAEKTGVEIEGIKAVNPANNELMPVFVADYVLAHYGTGAIMGVPAHDERDFDFARQFNLPLKEVISNPSEKSHFGFYLSDGRYSKPYTGEGILIHSGRFDGLESPKARGRIFEFLKQKGKARKAVHYKLRDWVFSRQRYWGEPIPLIYCPKCGWVPVPEKDLPVKLPKIKNYKPTSTGESPLAKVKEWVETKCPKCGGPARRETDVMPNWAGSNWYYLRYCDPKNNKELASFKKLRYWMPVDWYNGGMEHTTLHLLYSRFIFKFLWDIGVVPKSIGPEPYKKRTSHGMVLGEGGIKMSKSKGNVINPNDVIDEFGADTLRVYEMFMGPFEQAIAWDTKGVRGVHRFLQKVWAICTQELSFVDASKKYATLRALEVLLHKTIKKVSDDIEQMKFNTAVSALMEFCNEWSRLQNNQAALAHTGQKKRGVLSKRDIGKFLKILLPFAPHMAEELWHLLGYRSSIFKSKWPRYNQLIIKEEKVNVVVQVNGKKRAILEMPRGSSQKEVEKAALQNPKVRKWVSKGNIKKKIFVADKILNIVIR